MQLAILAMFFSILLIDYYSPVSSIFPVTSRLVCKRAKMSDVPLKKLVGILLSIDCNRTR